MQKTLKVMIFHPAGDIEYKIIDNSLSALQKIVGGHIESLYDPHCLCGHGYCNDEGIIMGLPGTQTLRSISGSGSAVMLSC